VEHLVAELEFAAAVDLVADLNDLVCMCRRDSNPGLHCSSKISNVPSVSPAVILQVATLARA
jgi:hypothetical protein